MKYIFSLVFCLFLSNANAQLNFKVSYDGAYFNANKINAIASDYNKNTLLTDKKFRSLYFLNGIGLGLRYRWEFLAFEADYTNNFNSRAQTIWTSDAKEDKKTQTYSVGVEKIEFGTTIMLGRIGVGAALSRNYFNISRKFVGQSKRQPVSAKAITYNAATIYAQYEGRMNSVLHFCVRPYFQMPLNAVVNVKNFQDKISPSSQLNIADGYEQDMTLIGLKLIFCNGRQNED